MIYLLLIPIILFLLFSGGIPFLKNPLFSFFLGFTLSSTMFEMEKIFVIIPIVFSILLLFIIKPLNERGTKTQQGNSGYVIGSVLGILFYLFV